MKTKQTILCGVLAVIFALGFVACENPAGGGTGDVGKPATITYTVAQTGGTNNTATSTGIVFTFSASVSGLTADNITVSEAAAKGTAPLSGSGKSWTLPITVNAAGLANVSINKSGIEAATKTVTVHKQGQATPEYWSITWNLNGGEKGASLYPEQIVKGAVLAAPSPDPTKTGNTFGGWYTNAALTQTYTFGAVTANLTLYAKWVTATGTLPAITTATLPDGIAGTAYSQTLTATGTAPITWSIASGALPAGLTLAEATGAITGTPTSEGTSTFTVKAANAAGSATQALTITVLPAYAALYGTWISTTGSWQPYTLTISAGTIRIEDKDGDFVQYADVVWTAAENTNAANKTNYPNGFTFTGTKTNQTYGNEFGFVALSTDGQSVYVGSSASLAFSGLGGSIYSKATPTITTTSLPGGTVGTAYSQTLAATGTTPITWSLDSGALPDGLTLAESGAITGTPTAEGTSAFTVKAANDAGSDTKALSITIAAGGNPPEPTTREVTIAMWDNADDGWDGNGALRINVNGTDIASNVKVSATAAQNTPSGQTSANTYTFDVNSGDEVKIYWIAGTAQSENSFIVYYTDTPPNPAFTASNNNSWNGTNALAYRLSGTGSNTLSGVSGGTLLGEFTVGGGVITPDTITYTAAANGNSTTTTTAITLTFSAAVTGLTADDIAVENGTGSATKGALTGSGASYSLAVTVATAGNVTVSITKTGIESGSKTVAVYKGTTNPTDITYTAAANGNSDTDTTAITLAFNAAVTGLTASDIAVENDTGSVTKGALTGSGASYSLAVTVATAGNVTVSINKTGIESGNKTVAVYKAVIIAPTITTASLPNGFVSTAYSQTLAATGTAPITWTTESGTLPAGLTLATSGAITGTPEATGSSTFTVKATNAAGEDTHELTITVAPASYAAAIPLTENVWADGNIPTSNQQWFSFTATASTQYIHFEPYTLDDVYVQVYDSSGAEAGSQTRLYIYDTRTSLTLSSGQTYYIRVRPYGSTGSGTYRIGYNTSTTAPPYVSNPIPLTENQWADGRIPTAGGLQFFSFTATASTQYIHFSGGTLTSVYVQVYDSNGTTTVGGSSNLYSSTTSTSLTLTSGQTYYIRVRPSGSSSGTYRIMFNVFPTMPIPLTENVWADGNIPTSGGEQWFTFTATAATQYIQFDSSGTLKDVNVQVYASNGTTTVGSETRLYGSGSTTRTSRTLTSGQTYYIKVTPYNSSDSGTYRIAFNASSNGELFDQWPPNAVPLTANTWADGNIPTSGDRQQWFSFTATSSTQYIHFDPTGTLKDVYVQVYTSGGTASGDRTNLYGSTTRTSRSLTSGQTYYIKVTPYSGSGTYRIGFNTSTIPPFPPPTTATLTANTWADGNIPTAGGEQWFTFTATASTQYIYLSSITGTLTNVYVQVYNSSGATVGSQTDFSLTNRTSRTLTSGQTYYIRVTPYRSSGTNSSGTYQIRFTA